MKNNKSDRLNKCGRVAVYAICAALVVFYCLVLWWGFNPNVGIEYRMYYLTHELSDWPGYGNLKYTYGTKEICIERNEKTLADIAVSNTLEVICARKGQGFAKANADGVMPDEDKSYIYYLPSESADMAVFTVEIKEFQGDGVSVYADDKLIGTINSEVIHSFQVGNTKENQLLTIRFDNNGSTYTLYSVILDK